MSAVPVESDRIMLRDWNPDTEASQAFEMYGDPDVMKFIGDGRCEESVVSQREALKKRNGAIAQLNNGSGFWAIFDKHCQEIVGTAILKQLPDGNNIATSDWEVGWHLKRTVWGQGYATEAGRLVIDYAFQVLRLPVLYSVVMPPNIASIRATQRLGMRPCGRTTQYYEAELELFELINLWHG